MTQFTQDKWLNFVIDNYSEIKSLTEVLEHARTNLPNKINSAIIDYITELNGDYFSDNNIGIGGEDKAIWWYEQGSFDEDKDLGTFFGFDWVECQNLIALESFGESASFYLYIVPSGKKADRTQKIMQLRKAFEKNKNEFLKKNIAVCPDEDDENVLARYYLRDINISTLKSPEKFKKYVQASAVKFTDAIITNEILTNEILTNLRTMCS